MVKDDLAEQMDEEEFQAEDGITETLTNLKEIEDVIFQATLDRSLRENSRVVLVVSPQTPPYILLLRWA